MNLIHGDNLNVMKSMESNFIDLIYADPPFNSGNNYIEFDDRFQSINNYISFIIPRLEQFKRILTETGTILLQLDQSAHHYAKVEMDKIFGIENFRNEIVWQYGKMSNGNSGFPKNHGVILRYTKTGTFCFNHIKGGESEYKKRFKNYLTGNKVLYGSVWHLNDKLITRRTDNMTDANEVVFDFDKEFKKQGDVIYCPIVKGNSKEFTGYPTQKPIELIKKLISSCSNKSDLVLDPFCGSGTTLVAAKELCRKFIGIDGNERAIEIARKRLDILSQEVL